MARRLRCAILQRRDAHSVEPHVKLLCTVAAFGVKSGHFTSAPGFFAPALHQLHPAGMQGDYKSLA
jgi:hypothetical protein